MAPRSKQPIAALLMLLAGCGSTAGFPSLAPRPIERQSGALPPATGPCAAAESDGCYKPEPPKPVATADDPALRARIADLGTQARQGQADFAARLGAASAIIDRAGAVGSDGWIAAQQELSRLEASRDATLEAANALDGLALERAGQATSEADLAAIAAAAEAARKLADAQQLAIAPLRAKLDRP